MSRFIVFDVETPNWYNNRMYNPEIICKSVPYETEEGCLSLLGGPRKTTRYQMIKVRYQDDRFRNKTQTYTGFTAQIIQHEVDHCNGILI